MTHVRKVESERTRVESERNASQKSEKILENHAREMAKQLAVVVHENRKLNGTKTDAKLGATALQKFEEERETFRTVSDAIEQNEALRKAIARLQADLASKSKLVEPKASFNVEAHDLVKQLRSRLVQKSSEVSRLQTCVDEMKIKLAQPQIESTKVAVPPEPALAVLPSVEQQQRPSADEQVAALRDEFKQILESVQNEAAAVRASELEARKALAAAQKQADIEKDKCQVTKEQLELALKRNKDQQAKEDSLEQRISELQARIRDGDITTTQQKDLSAQLRSESERLKEQVALSRTRVQELEKSHAAMLAENATQAELVKELRTRSEIEVEKVKGFHEELAVAFQEREKLLRDKLKVSEHTLKDRQRLVDELTSAKSACEAEMSKLASAKNTCELELSDMRARVASLKSSADVSGVGEVGTNDASRQPVDVDSRGGLDGSALESNLKFAEERISEHKRNAARLHSMIEGCESENHSLRDKIATLQSEVENHCDRQAALERERDDVTKRIRELEAEAESVRNQVGDLQKELDVKQKDLLTAMQNGEQQRAEGEKQMELKERELADLTQKTENLRQQAEEAIQGREQYASALRDARTREEALHERMIELQAERANAEANASRLVSAATSDVEALRRKLSCSETHVENLRLEVQRYRNGLLASAERRSEEDFSEAAQRLTAELSHARESGEMQRHELELERDRLEQESATLRAEVADLMQRLDGEQQRVQRLSEDMRRQQDSTSERGQISLMESENHRLQALVRSLQSDRTAQSSVTEGSSQGLPQQTSEDVQGLKDTWARERQDLETKVDEWKQSYDQVARAVKQLRQDKIALQGEKTDFSQKLTEITERRDDLQKQNTNLLQQLTGQKEKTAQIPALKVSIDNLQKEQAEKASTIQKYIQDMQTKEQERKGQLKKIADLEGEVNSLKANVKTLQEEKRKKDEDLRKVQASVEAREGEAKEASKEADRALALVGDYQLVAKSLSDRQRKFQRGAGFAEPGATVPSSSSLEANAESSDRGVTSSFGSLAQQLGGASTMTSASQPSDDALDTGVKRSSSERSFAEDGGSLAASERPVKTARTEVKLTPNPAAGGGLFAGVSLGAPPLFGAFGGISESSSAAAGSAPASAQAALGSSQSVTTPGTVVFGGAGAPALPSPVEVIPDDDDLGEQSPPQ
eukprot:TRINITY_DN24882_c0_g2_i2.p1 TRINITY_DN24882_c0_g2~~TRINITY_DN24882_c0_g2_i2.p1  ORF type:complete len:1172 (-),score=284.86 TRINITY_DN24882_c0_g2_i2:64-3579(-)